MPGNQVKIAVSAEDRASAKLRQITDRLEALTRPARDVHKQLSRFGDVSGLTRLASGLIDVAGKTAQVASAAARVVPAFGVLTGAASVAGLYRLVSGFGRFGQELQNTAARIGVTAGQLQGLQGSARLAGASGEALTGGLEALGQTMFDAVGGRNPEAINWFRSLGVEFRRDALHARGVVEVLPELADRIAAIRDPYAQAAAATALFGGAGRDLLPWLRKGSAGMAEYTALAKRYGVVSEDGARAAIALQQAQTQLELSVGGLRTAIGTRLAPVLTPLLRHWADWIAAHRELISQRIAEVVGAFAQRLQSIDWDATIKGIGQFLQETQGVVDAIGGWKVALAALLVYTNSTFAVGMTKAIVSIATLAMANPVVAAVAAVLGLTAYGVYRAVTNDAPHQTGTWQHGAAAGTSATLSNDQTLSPQMRGLLDTVAQTESNGRYDTVYGGGSFNDFSQHPNRAVPITTGPNAGKSSNAAGRYQFLKSTWDEAQRALHLPDFSPESQDKAAAWLARREYSRRTGRDLEQDLSSSDPATRAAIGAVLHDTWTSLPGGSEAQAGSQDFAKRLGANIAQESGPAAQGPAVAGPAATVNGQVDTTITLKNAPPGTKVSSKSSGALMSPKPPKVVHAMSGGY